MQSEGAKRVGRRIEIELSKSLVNRALIVKSFLPEISWQGISSCRDVMFLSSALQDLKTGKTEFYLGDGGTTFRFFLARVSRLCGDFALQVDSNLYFRPNQPLIHALEQLGVQCQWDQANSQIDKKVLRVRSNGWSLPSQPVQIDCNQSSQFLSALILSSFFLDGDISFHCSNLRSSQQYLQNTIAMVQEVGMKVEWMSTTNLRLNGSQISSSSHVKNLHIEVDASNAWSIVSVLFASESFWIENFFPNTQADSVFCELLQEMGVDCFALDQDLQIKKSNIHNGLDASFDRFPDLFPCFVAAASLSPYSFRFRGLENLRHKESDRLGLTLNLLESVGKKFELREKPFLELVLDRQRPQPSKKEIVFEDQNDHRMVFAAAVFRNAGWNIRVRNPNCVAKSFPDFFPQVGFSL